MRPRQHLEKKFKFPVKLLLFATSFILSYSNLKAEIIYTDISPDTTIRASSDTFRGDYYMDMNGDGENEFDFRHFDPGVYKAVEVYCFFEGADEGILCSGMVPLVLSQGTEISVYSGMWIKTDLGSSNTALILNSSDVQGESWEGAVGKFLGLRFQLGGNWHYGWARLNVPADASSFTIRDFAYNTVVDEPIAAGDGIVGINDNEDSAPIQIRLEGDVIDISGGNNLLCSRFILSDVLGRVIANGETPESGKIRISSLVSGAYFFILFDEKKIISKKLFVP